MLVNGQKKTSIWYNDELSVVEILDQSKLPFEVVTRQLRSLDDFADAIQHMWVRGAPLIGVTAGFGLAECLKEDASDLALNRYYERLHSTRPTAINLKWALDLIKVAALEVPESSRHEVALECAKKIREGDIEVNRLIGVHGLEIIREIAKSKASNEPIRILTHCNAGWLATVDWGTATSPIYNAHQEGIKLHIYVDETRPRNQGALTAWELSENRISNEFIVDNVGGHLMQHGMVDLVIVGTDRTSRSGDVCNKIGTYLKALAAFDNGVPFYVALPSSTIDWTIEDGVSEIPIETRDSKEVSHVQGYKDSLLLSVAVIPEDIKVLNYAFDVTPNRLVTGLITERGVAEANAESLLKLFPEKIES
jgi:methylthioribose-1-phosphate isomerase